MDLTTLTALTAVVGAAVGVLGLAWKVWYDRQQLKLKQPPETSALPPEPRPLDPPKGTPQGSPLDPPPKGRLQDYLRWVMARTGHLSLGGLHPGVAGRDAHKRLRLGAVYTALRTLAPRHGADFEASGPDFGPKATGRMESRTEGPPLSALEQLERHERLVLLGDPGSGKSTFLSFVALCLAGESLSRIAADLPTAGPDAVDLGLLTAPLPTDDGGEEEERQPWTHGALIPLRVVLRDFAARGPAETGAEATGAGTARDLWEFICQELEGAVLGDFAPYLERALRDGRCLVLLDGLDEVPEAAARRRQICAAVEAFAQRFAASRIVLTSRIYAYQKQEFRLEGFAATTLAPFGAGQIRRFVERWYAHVAELEDLQADDAAGRAEQLKHAIFASSRLHDLAERPLLLTLTASLHAWRGGSLPERRERLYDAAVELLLDFWERRRLVRDEQGAWRLLEPSLAEYLRTDKEALQRVLEELAWEAHGSQPEEQQETADVPQAELVGRLMRLREDPEGNPAKLVDYLSERAGLLEPRGVEVYTFPHRTFQEYLAARHLHRGPFDNDEIAALVRRDPNRWREVLLLVAARSGPKDVWLLVESLLETEEPASPEERAWGAQLAGQAAAETAHPERLGPGNRRRLARLQERLLDLLGGDQLPASERLIAGASLERLGDPRFDAEQWFLEGEGTLQGPAGFVEIPGGVYRLGGEAYDDEKPEHSVELSRFYLGRHPVTVAQFRAFVEATASPGGDRGGEPAAYKVGDLDALEGLAHQPVVWVSWAEARAYCAWLTQRLRELAPRRLTAEPASSSFWQEVAAGELVADLPSEARWEAAARGPEAREYPWGSEKPTAELANFGMNVGHSTTVGIYAAGAGPFGTLDQAGNVWEWCLDVWDEGAYAKRVARGLADPVAAEGDEEVRVLRGGAWSGPAQALRAAYRGGSHAGDRNGDVGFRVCCAAPEA